MTPVFRVVYHTAETIVADSRIACARHIKARPHEVFEQVIDETEDADLFCDDCVAGAPENKKIREVYKIKEA